MLSNKNDKRRSPLPPSGESNEKSSDHSTSRGETPLPQSITPPLPSPPGELERKCYYYGIPSGAPLVARSSTFVWEETSWPDGSPKKKWLYSIPKRYLESGHWEAAMKESMTVLNSKGVEWTTIDLLGIGYNEEEPERLPILWVGVKPNSLSGEDGVQAAIECKKVVDKYGLIDVHCEICESEVWPDYSKMEDDKGGKVLCRKKKRAAAKRAAAAQKKKYEQLSNPPT